MNDSEALGRLYRQLPAEAPSTRLDAKVLAAVNAELAVSREQRARSQRRWRYQVPLASAATLVVAVALFLHQPDTQQELLSPGSEERVASYSVLAHEALSDTPEDKNAPTHAYELRRLPPPPPPLSAPPPVPAPPMVAMIDLPAPNMARIAPMGIIADPAVPPVQLGALLNEAAGMPAKEFCERLQALWTATDTAPDCPTSDGQHEWPAPLAVTWQVTGGHVQSAELRR